MFSFGVPLVPLQCATSKLNMAYLSACATSMCHFKTEHGIFIRLCHFNVPLQNWTWHIYLLYLSSLKTEQNCCRPTCRCHHLGYSVPPALHRTIWCRSTFGPRGPGLSNPTSFLRPALPMAPTRDDNARDKRSVLRPNPATFLRDFALYMTMKYAIIRKRCLKHARCLTVYCRTFPFWEHLISAKIQKTRGQ